MSDHSPSTDQSVSSRHGIGQKKHSQPPLRRPCLLVGVGASAGGLQAYEAFFRSMPVDQNVAFVLVQHLDPNHHSLLAELISNYTEMPVEQIMGDTRPKCGHVYVIPPNRTLVIRDGVLGLAHPIEPHGRRLPINDFFRSLAADQRNLAVGIVLSGTGSDGALGLRAIKEAGGLTIAQSPDSAKFSGMPESAISTGMTDFVLPPEEMPACLLAHEKMLITGNNKKLLAANKEEELRVLDDIYSELKARTGHDFSSYKKNTVLRRLRRRMQIAHVANVDEYLNALRSDPREPIALFKDLLIGVTNFFRDPDAFEILQRDVIPNLFRADGFGDHIRVWVPACSTGEEAYSIAMLLLEEAEKHPNPARIQVFATDIDDRALDRARTGRYGTEIQKQLSPERLEKFFLKDANQYRVRKELRDVCLFSQHNIIKDPPFFQLDLVSCRNLLIYLEQDLQRKIIPLFHNALRDNGYLFLGTVESTSTHPELFRAVDKKLRVFQRLATSRRPYVDFPFAKSGGKDNASLHAGGQFPSDTESIGQRVQRFLLSNYAPTSVLINENNDVVYFFGDSLRFFSHKEGVPSLNVLKLAPRELGIALRTMIYQARAEQKKVSRRNVYFKREETELCADVDVQPFVEQSQAAETIIISIRDKHPGMAAGDDDSDGSGMRQQREAGELIARQLEDQLRASEERLQITIEELETSNEELKSSNEELLSMNEELQSSNEELHTSREELRHSNEQLYEANSRLAQNVRALDSSNNDLQNLLRNTQIATIFVDLDKRIRRYTSPATKLFNLIETDIGRSITDLMPMFKSDGLIESIQKVIDELDPVERQLPAHDGRTYMLRILPYRTTENTIDGAVLTFVDITEWSRTFEQRSRLAALLESSEDAIVAFNLEGLILHWNQGATNTYGRSAEEMIGRSIFDIVKPEIWETYRGIISDIRNGRRFKNVYFERSRADGTPIILSASISPYYDSQGNVIGAAETARDNTEKWKAERQLHDLLRQNQEHLREVEVINDSMHQGLIVCDLEGNIKRMNRSARVLLGHEPAGQFHDNIRSYRHLVTITGSSISLEELAIKAAQKIRGGDRIVEIEIATRARNGQERICLLDAVPILGNSNVVSQVVITLLDITARKHSEEERKIMESRLLQAQKLESLGVLAGGIAHDFNNLLVGILGNASDALEQNGTLKDCTENLRAIETAARRAADLSNQMLAYSGKGKLNVSELDLNFLIREMAGLMHSSISRKAHLQLALADNLPAIIGDQTQMRQVVMNLLTNASEALADREGEIVIRTDVCYLTENALRDAVVDGHVGPGNFLLLEVRDNGIGMNLETLARIFDPFFTTKFTGRGLGLAAVIGIVRGHQGVLKVSSEPGMGTTFQVFLPALDHQAASTRLSEDTESVDGTISGTILLVDDSDTVIAVAERILLNHGFKVIIARDGEEGVNLFRKHMNEIDCVILDLTMPKKDGHEAFDEIMIINPNIPVIISSGFHEQDAMDQFRGEKIAGFLQKPYSSRTFISRIRRVIETTRKGETT